MARVLCVGELLWDLFPDTRRLGGAPANVAHHLTQAGHETRLLSCVGRDEAGRLALAELAAGGLDTTFVGVDESLPTGCVRISLDAAGVPDYQIMRQVAWDSIRTPEELHDWLAGVDALVFGTLAQRSAENRETYRSLLRSADHCLTVLDLNLRHPHGDAEVIRGSLEFADILKLNRDELELLPGLLDAPNSQEFAFILRDRFELRRIYVTLGAAGCDVVSADGIRRVEAPQVAVADTVGAGDAFTAAMVDGELRGLPLEITAAKACALGAYVAMQAGAMPPWPEKMKLQFRT